MYTVEIMAHNTYYFQVYEEIWGLQIDGKSVSGLDFYKQETRTAKFTCLLDAWLYTHIIEAGDADIYKNYLRMLFVIKKDNETLYSGFMRVTDYETEYITETIKEITITLYDWLYIIIDQAGEINKSIVQGTEYHPIDEVRTGLMMMNANMFGLTDGLLYYAAYNDYDNMQWTPYFLNNFELFNQANYGLSILGQNNYDIMYEVKRYIIIEAVSDAVYMSYVYYFIRLHINNSFGGGSSLALTEKLRYVKLCINGINVTTLINVNETHSDTFTNNGDDNVVGVLGATYNIPADNDTELITINGNEYLISDGKLLFNGYTVFDPIVASSTQDVNIMDWIRLCGMINAVYLELNYCAVHIRNKISLYDTNFETTLPGEVLQFRQIANTYRNDEIEINTDLIVNGKELAVAINNYFKGLITGGLRNMYEMVLSGCHPDVNLRYQYDGIMLYVMTAEYDIDNEVTKLKALGKRL